MRDALLLIAVLVPCWYAYRRSVWHGLIKIDHVVTFTFGFLFYWILPVLLGVYGSHLAPRSFAAYFNLFDQRLVTPYIAASIGLYVCFVIGDAAGVRLFCEKAVASPKVPKLALSVVSAIGCLLAIYTWYTLRAELLLPYSTNLTFKTARGTLTSCIVLLGVVALIYTVDRPEMSWRKRLASPYFLAFLVGCAVLLRLGSRGYVASFFLMFAVYQSSFRRALKWRTVVAGAIVLTLLLGAIGMWRSQGDVSEALINVLQEPVLTSLSLMHHLRFRGIAWTNSPVYLASDFSNLIPALVLPDKASLRKRPPVYNPLGGLHSFVSFNLNFGVIGTAVCWLLLPMAFRYLRSLGSSTLFATMYIMCSGWMAFSFFRDPFFISLVKAILQDSILAPVAVVAFGRFLSAACAPVGPNARGVAMGAVQTGG